MDNEKKIEEVLALYEKEQVAFENHWLWQELGTTPKEFFSQVRQYVKESGVAQNVWEEKLQEAKHALEVKLKEQRGQYKAVNYKVLKGIRV
ncbi:MAG: hypothetical protein ABII18_07670 [bacterium]|nr:hypothetical protein [bacterium]MBU1917292.1 hypothetical protein [bacterium]